MIQSFLDVWGWAKSQAITTILAIALLFALAFAYLGHRPFTYEVISTRTENSVEYDTKTCYAISTTWTKEGAKLSVVSNSVMSRVENKKEGTEK